MKKTLALLLLLSLSHSFSQSLDKIKEENVKFMSNGVKLEGTIYSPEKPYAAIVFVHGSGMQKRNLSIAKQFANQGIAAFVYDKRGVGNSGGKYESEHSVSEFNLKLLATDSKSAINLIAKDSRFKNIPIGLTGISQAGWIIPIAAEKNELIDFIVLWSGPVCKVSEEDIYSKYTNDKDFKNIPTYDEALKSRKTKYIWPSFLGEDIDSSLYLEYIEIPGLWIFGGQDGSIPVDLSVNRLNTLINNSKKYEYIIFHGLGHNNVPQTFNYAVDWIKKNAFNKEE